jgi:hypothetical protein
LYWPGNMGGVLGEREGEEGMGEPGGEMSGEPGGDGVGDALPLDLWMCVSK